MTAVNPYAPPQRDDEPLPALVSGEAGPPPYFAVTQEKLAVLLVLTSGLYAIYWFARHWSQQRAVTGEPMWPAARGLFSLFFVHQLFQRVHRDAAEVGAGANWRADGLAAACVMLDIVGFVASWIENPAARVVSVAALCLVVPPMLAVQGTVNRLLAMTHPDHDRNGGATPGALVMAVIGVLSWALFLLALARG